MSFRKKKCADVKWYWTLNVTIYNYAANQGLYIDKGWWWRMVAFHTSILSCSRKVGVSCWIQHCWSLFNCCLAGPKRIQCVLGPVLLRPRVPATNLVATAGKPNFRLSNVGMLSGQPHHRKRHLFRLETARFWGTPSILWCVLLSYVMQCNVMVCMHLCVCVRAFIHVSMHAYTCTYALMYG